MNLKGRRKTNFVALLFPLLVAFMQEQLVDAIKCYVCQSNVDPKCADPFDNLTLPITDCDAYPRADLAQKSEYDIIEEKGFFSSFGQPSPVKPLQATMCRKIRQKVNGEWRTIRGCGYLGPPGDSQDAPESNCQVRHGNYDIFMETCTCNSKDGCNGVTGISQLINNRILVLMTAFSFLFLLHHKCFNLLPII